jgi:hypothetical protein
MNEATTPNIVSPSEVPSGGASPPGSGGAAVIEIDLPCVQCDYNLRGLSPAGDCPECGRAIRDALSPQCLMFADPRWLKRLIWGQWLCCLTFVWLIGGAVGINLDWDLIGEKTILRLGWAFGLLAGVVWWAWLTTRRQHGWYDAAHPARTATLARCLVTSGTAFLVSVPLLSWLFGWFAFGSASAHRVGIPMVIGGFDGLLLGVACAVWVLRRIAQRMNCIRMAVWLAILSLIMTVGVICSLPLQIAPEWTIGVLTGKGPNASGNDAMAVIVTVEVVLFVTVGAVGISNIVLLVWLLQARRRAFQLMSNRAYLEQLRAAVSVQPA